MSNQKMSNQNMSGSRGAFQGVNKLLPLQGRPGRQATALATMSNTFPSLTINGVCCSLHVKGEFLTAILRVQGAHKGYVITGVAGRESAVIVHQAAAVSWLNSDHLELGTHIDVYGWEKPGDRASMDVFSRLFMCFSKFHIVYFFGVSNSGTSIRLILYSGDRR